MGKQTHPEGIRIDINGWKRNVWYAKTKTEYSRLIYEDYIINEVIKKYFDLGIIADVFIERANNNTVVTLHTPRPGFVVGDKGANIEEIRKKIKALINSDVKINISEVYKPEASAKLICDQIVKLVEQRGNYKKVAKSVIRNVERSLVVKGISITVSGRLNGASIARTERFRSGSVSRQNFSHKISMHCHGAKTKFGICGVKVLVSLGGK